MSDENNIKNDSLDKHVIFITVDKKPSTSYNLDNFGSIQTLFQKAISEINFLQKHTNGDFLKYVKFEINKLKTLTPSKRSIEDVEKIDTCLTLKSAESYVASYVKNASSISTAYNTVNNVRELTDFGKSFLAASPIIKMSYFMPTNAKQKWIKDAMNADGSREQAILLQMCEESYFGTSNKADEVVEKINKMLFNNGWIPLNENNNIDKVIISCIKNDERSAQQLKQDGPIGGIYTLAALIN